MVSVQPGHSGSSDRTNIDHDRSARTLDTCRATDAETRQEAVITPTRSSDEACWAACRYGSHPLRSRRASGARCALSPLGVEEDGAGGGCEKSHFIR